MNAILSNRNLSKKILDFKRGLTMDVTGYSERGVINSLIYEIDCLGIADKFLPALFSKAMFEGNRCPSKIPGGFKTKTIFVEQSFSEFGDADLLILGNANGQKISIFIEAKVKTFHKKTWEIKKNQFDPFVKILTGSGTGGISSNLFVQLYHKMRLMDGLPKLISPGISFPPWSSKPLRKILNGDNIHEIVKKAVDLLLNYKDDSYYLALVPGDRTTDCNFLNDYRGHLASAGLIPLIPGWDFDKFGILVWEDVETVCNSFHLHKTINVFNHNRGQIY
jgi:hypothetical protein